MNDEDAKNGDHSNGSFYGNEQPFDAPGGAFHRHAQSFPAPATPFQTELHGCFISPRDVEMQINANTENITGDPTRGMSPLTDIPESPKPQYRTLLNDEDAIHAIEAELESLINGPVKSPTMVCSLLLLHVHITFIDINIFQL